MNVFKRWVGAPAGVSLWLTLVSIGAPASAQEPAGPEAGQAYSAYLFTYFVGNGPGQEQVHYAVSDDGFNYTALNGNRPVIDSKAISASGGVRDPHILRRADGQGFYMVVTDLYVPEMGWNNTAMVLMKSDDLIRWESSVINIPRAFPDPFGNVNRVWAPQTIYDAAAGKYMVYFSMKLGRGPDTLYYAYANEDFTALEHAPRVLYQPPADSNTRACIDADIIEKDGRFYLFHKAEDGDPGIKLAVSDKLTEGYVWQGNDRVDRERRPVEGSGIFKLNDRDAWVLMYDVYTSGRYQFTISEDLRHFEPVDHQVSMDFHPRHGTVMPITDAERTRLMRKWGSVGDVSLKATGEGIKTRNVSVDAERRTIWLPVRRGTDLTTLDPGFVASLGAEVTPDGPRDFSGGTLRYRVALDGLGAITYRTAAQVVSNPVLDGFYADPDIIYSEKEKKYYLYPTSDGFTGWSGTYFEAFSSENLVDWTNEGVILDLEQDVAWADRNAWAPCIIEKQVDGEYRYFYYFTAAQKIGVAVSDSPAGPFRDSGKPLIDWKPEGVNGGQEIDPDVFTDPASGKSYLYWGNGYLAAAELNDDMLSIKRDTLRVLTPDRTFREGAHVFFRDGTYYFLWSEDDTRSENYRVRYAVANSPLGPLTIPDDNLVIAKDPDRGIYATGHNSTIQVPGKDEWYLVYHRFTYPDGITMGRDAGYHREVCIDRLRFARDGSIIRAQPTHTGVGPVE